MRKIIITLLLLISATGAGFSTLSCSRTVDTITVAWSPFESTALMWIAEDQQFFISNGLGVTLRKYDSGAGSLAGMLNGEADIAVGVAEFPAVGRAFRKERMSIIGSVNKADFVYIVGRKDRGIMKVPDLKGKRVGTTIGTIAEFFLGRSLDLNGLSVKDIVLVDVKTPEEWVNSVAEGKIDAVATAQPYASSARERLGTNAVFLSAQGGQLLNGLVITSDKWITGHPGPARRFLKALAKAEEFLMRNPARAKAIVQERLGLDPGYMATFWSQNQFSLTLDQSVITSMEDEARWMIAGGLTTEKQVPDFLDFIREGDLKKIKPEAVNIIR